MKNRFIMFFLMVAIVAVLVLGIFVFLSVWDSSGSFDSGKMKAIGFLDIENDPLPDPPFGVNAGFAVSPYQADNSGRDMAVMIMASVSYILREVKHFALFVVVLTVLALNAYALIFYFVINKISKKETATTINPQTSPQTVSSAVMGHINIKPAIGALSLEIDEMLAQIDAITEKSKLNQKVLLK